MATKRATARRAPIERVIDDLEALKVISDALRMKILELTSSDPDRAWSAKELAASLGTSQTKLYHHLALLEEHGFLRVAETRMVSGITERRYAATAHGYRIERSLLAGSGGEAAVSDTLDAIFDKTRSEIMASIHDGLIDDAETDPARRRMAMSASHVRLSPDNVRKVMRLIEQLAKRAETDDPDGTPYGLVLAFYPRSNGGLDR
jgi:DNA-binding transcriptional ArsR family regulator